MADQEPTQIPHGGGQVSGGSQSSAYSGRKQNSDPTAQPGQYPPLNNDIFGGPLPSGTGAPGTSSGAGNTDVTAEGGQLSEDFTGVTDAEISNTGAPGTSTTPNDSGAGETQVSFTQPGSFLSGTYQSASTGLDVDGPGSATEANDQGYGSGGPQLPGLKGNEPAAGGDRFQPGSGRVLRGGRSVRG